MESIHQLIPKIIADMPAIPRDATNEQQRFKYRSIDSILDHLNPLLAKYGVFFLPRVIERIQEPPRQTRGGGLLYAVHLHVSYRFYGPGGDYVEADAWGEGTDSGDKATNKAMTGAMKYMLNQVFAIACNDEADADATTPPETLPPRQPLDGWNTIEEQDRAHDGYVEKAKSLPPDKQNELRKARATLRLPWPMSAEQFQNFLEYVDPILNGEFGSLDDQMQLAQ